MRYNHRVGQRLRKQFLLLVPLIVPANPKTATAKTSTGSVGYTFQTSKFEVSRDMITKQTTWAD